MLLFRRRRTMRNGTGERCRVSAGLASRVALLAGLLGLAAGALAADQPAPNVIFIMVDDMGYADLGVTGGRHNNTPHIDQLAAEGVLLTEGYANSAVCSPTRAALMTGNYQYRYEIGLHEPIGPWAPDAGLPADQPTLPQLFVERGYHTSLIGKWHLGNPPEQSPLKHGYQHFFGIIQGGADYFRHRVELAKDSPIDGLFEGEQKVDRPGYLTTLFTDEAVRVIEQTSDQPFFISLHYTAPHWPWEGPEDEAVAAALTEIFHWDGGSLATYAAMMRAADDGVGKIMATLKATGQDQNTLVVFTSDNGAERFSDTWPYVGYKGELLEGGIRAPIIMRWPARLPTGKQLPQIMLSMDFLPTLLAATGQPVDDTQFDGMNLLPVLLGEQEPAERTVYWRFRAHDQAAVRQGEWKYLRIGGKEHLFNLSVDARERAQLERQHPEKFAELRALWERWNSEMLPYPQQSFSQDNRPKFPDRY